MVVERTEIEVSVSRLRINLVKVDFDGGHHIVIGGRLVSSTENGVTKPHPDMPAYEMSQFPCDFNKWADGEVPGVTVTLVRGSARKKLGCVRACTLLFTPREPKAVREWIGSQS